MLPENAIVYDGECPFCANYIALTRLKESAGTVEMIDARQSNHPLVIALRTQGFNLDAGMVLKLGDVYFHGDKALQKIAEITDDSSSMINKVNAHLFKNSWVSESFYPLFRAFRKATLKVKGVPPL